MENFPDTKEDFCLNSSTSGCFRLAKDSLVGGYRIERVIGKGGMGIVYKAREQNPEREVALKILLPQALESVSRKKRFLREIEIAAQLEHPNLVKIYKAGATNDLVYMAMEYVDGDSLDKHMQQEGVTDEDKLQLLLQAARGIHHAHEYGVIHRDIKPSNIMITRDNRALVMDFGLARSISGRAPREKLTKTGEILGTLRYMSPEQLDSSPTSIDIRSDIYSLGTILYEIITGRPMVCGDGQLGIIYNLRFENPVSPREIDVAISPDLELIWRRATAKKKERRYSSASQFADDLQNFLQKRRVSTRWDTISLWLASRPGKVFQAILALCLLLVALVISSMIILPKLDYSNEIVSSEWTLQSPEKRVKQLRRELQSRPDDDALRYELIPALVELGDYQNAAREYDKIREKRKIPPSVLLALIKTHYSLRDFDLVEVLADQILTHKTRKDEAEARYYLALIAFQKQNFAKAVRNLDMIKVDPQLPSLYRPSLLQHLGICYYRLASQAKDADSFARARENLKEAQKWLPESVQVHEYLGKSILHNRGLHGGLAQLKNIGRDLAEQAKECFARCVELQPENGKYYAYLGRMQFIVGENEKAEYEKAEYEKAENSLQNALRINSWDIDTLGLLMVVQNKRLVWQHGRHIMMLDHFSQFRHIPPPDLFIDILEKPQFLYRQAYIERRSALQQSGDPQNFLAILHRRKKTPRQILHNIAQGLISLRYHPDLMEDIKSSINSPQVAEENKQLLRDITEIIEDKKRREYRLSMYYCIARLRQSDIIIYRQMIADPLAVEFLGSILDDPQEKIVLRYLAACTLIDLLEFSMIEARCWGNDEIRIALSICALREKGFPTARRRLGEIYLSLFSENKAISERDDQDGYTLLAALLARHMEGLGERKSLNLLIKNDGDPRIRLFAAANFARSKNEKLAGRARRILIQHLDLSKIRHLNESKKTLQRCWIHYHLWSSFGFERDSWELSKIQEKISLQYKKYHSAFRQGLRDDNTVVQAMVLQYASRMDLDKGEIAELVSVIRTSKDKVVRLFAIVALASNEGEHPLLEEICRNEKEHPIIRIFAFTSPILGTVYKAVRARDILLRLLPVLGQVRKMARQLYSTQDSSFRGLMAWIGIACGDDPRFYFDNESNEEIKAAMLAGFRIPALFSTLSKGKWSDHRMYILARENLENPFLLASLSAHVSFVVHGSDEEREEIYQKARQWPIRDPKRRAVAIGFYSTMAAFIKSQISLERRFYNLGTKQIYSIYLQKLCSIGQTSPAEGKQLVQFLDRALELYPHPRFYFERGLLFKEENRRLIRAKKLDKAAKMWDKARRDFDSALSSLSPAQDPYLSLLYHLEYLDSIATPAAEEAHFVEIQKSILANNYSRDTLRALRQSIWKVYSRSSVYRLKAVQSEKIFAKICVEDAYALPYSYLANYLLGIHQQKQAEKYVGYYVRRYRYANPAMKEDEIIAAMKIVFPQFPAKKWPAIFAALDND